MHILTEMEETWVKVKAHQKRNVKSLHEVINNEMETLANTLHKDQAWMRLSMT